MDDIGFLSRLWRFIREPERHETRRLRMMRPANLFQPSGTTEDNRYPDIFAFVREQVGDGPDHRILSFGCATGEEVSSLRRIFPAASIKGIDISPYRIAIARARCWLGAVSDARSSFATARSGDQEAANSYDAIFAMAVFRHGDLNPGPPRCDHRLRFENYQRTVAGLARCLRPGGLLCFRHANFRFSDTDSAAGFETALRLPAYPNTPVYGRDNQKLCQDPLETVVVRKQPAPCSPAKGRSTGSSEQVETVVRAVELFHNGC